MRHKIDLRGLACPEPVLRTKRLFDDPEVECVEALVDDEICVSNLERLSATLNTHVSSKAFERSYMVTIERIPVSPSEKRRPQVSPEISRAKQAQASPLDQPVSAVLFLSRDTLGEGDPEFSRALLNLFLQTALGAGERPQAILLANSGVKLMDPDSPARKVLNDFRQTGCLVLACGMCLDYYGLKDRVAKDQITDMVTICQYLFSASKIVQP